MKAQLRKNLLIVTILASSPLAGAAPAPADNPSWAEQQARNAQMEREAVAKRDQFLQQGSQQVNQYQRWKQEWFQQHPNEPLPTMGELEKMHRGEIIGNINNDMSRMYAARQAKLKQEYLMAKQHQAAINAQQNITWGPQQWANWDQAYQNEQRRKAQEMADNMRQAAESFREEQYWEEQRKWASGH